MGDGAGRKLGWQGEDRGSYEAGMYVGPWQSRANRRPEREVLAPVRADLPPFSAAR